MRLIGEEKLMAKIKLSLETYRDKVYGCWIGKNAGGTMGGPLESLISPPIYDYISWCSNAVLGLGIIFISRFIDLITSEYKLPDYSTWNTILLIGGILMMVPPLSDFGGFIVFLLCIMIGGRLKKVTIS